MATPIPANGARFTAEEVVAATSGQLVAAGSGQVTGVATDSRSDVAGKLFVALRGDSFDGHAFLSEVIASGAAGVLVDRDVDVAPRCLVVRVPDTLVALGQLARMHRRRWGRRVVAIGGSAGKTTTRAATSALLERLLPGRVAYARGNLNNRIGVPMVLLAVEPDHEVAVVEIGTNRTGEVPLLAALCEPDVGVLTLIDLEHSEGLGDLDAIEVEEGALLAAVGPKGLAIGNVDDSRVRRQLGRAEVGTRVGYGRAADATYRIAAREPVGLDSSRLKLTRHAAAPLEFRCQLCGEPGALAAAAAVAVAEGIAARPLEPFEVEAALDGPGVREAGRLTPIELADGTVIVDDTYNSNPASARASVRTGLELAAIRGGRLVLVLGEMRELGSASADEHRRLGMDVVGSHPALLIGIAGDAERLVMEARDAGVPAEFVSDAPSALQILAQRLKPGDVVVVKASRGIRAEKIVEGLVATQGAKT